jgi:hypothetical protein
LTLTQSLSPGSPTACLDDTARHAAWGPDLCNVAAARHFVRASLLAWGAGDLSDAAVLVTSELVGNAVVHTATRVDVALQRLPDGLLLRVHDCSEDLPSRRAAGADAVDGRGLALLDGLCAGWGVVLDGEGGKAVWALLADG